MQHCLASRKVEEKPDRLLRVSRCLLTAWRLTMQLRCVPGCIETVMGLANRFSSASISISHSRLLPTAFEIRIRVESQVVDQSLQKKERERVNRTF